jgi:ABC-type sugar transport system ATPase subunit
MAGPILRMQGIEKRFFAVTAVDQVDLELFGGEVLALVGENGAGKSTLMKILSGSYPATSYKGRIEVGGEPVHFLTTADSERAGIEMIYQEISLHLDLSVAENIFLGKIPVRRGGLVDWKRMRTESLEILGTVGLEVDPGQNARSLSTSQQQLVCIAKALVRRPKILVLDEPTSALTEKEAQNLLRLIRELRAAGISFIYISHKLEEVFSVADRVMVLRDGKCVSVFRKEEVSASRVIEDMVGRQITTMYPKEDVAIGAEALRVDHLRVRSRFSADKDIIEDVSFAVRSGEIVGLGGLVGAGRSELVNAIFGSHPRKGGQIYIGGQKAELRSPVDAIRQKIGLLTEDRRATGYVGTMNIRENITLASFDKVFGRMFVKPGLELKEAGEYFRRLAIKAPGLETSVLSLSGGNQQKVVLAKWLLTDVRVLILDEPTKGIDVGAKVEIYTIIERLAKQGVAIIMISTELPELLAMCDRFVVLFGGKVQARFERGEVNEHSYMAAATGLHLA